MKFIIHIGWHKCGSTAIQQMLVDNSSELSRNFGICYPQLSRHGVAHHLLAWAMYEAPERSPAAKGIRIAESIQAQLDRIKAEAASLGCNTILLSSEELSNTHLYDPAQLQQALAGNEVTLIAYVRRQDFLVESAYGTSVRWLRQRWRGSFEEYLARYSTLRNLHYPEYFAYWKNLFGADNLSIRNFSPSAGWDVKKDFLHAIGISNPETLSMGSKLENRSLPVNVTQFLSLLNQAGAEDRLFEQFLSCFELDPDRFTAMHSTCHALMPLSQRLDFMAGYAASNREIGTIHFGKSDIFEVGNDEISRLSACSPPDPFENAVEILERLTPVSPELATALRKYLPPFNHGCVFMEKISRAPVATGNDRFTPVFVCGAPRSGTTLLLSLICTSRSANPLSAECDYLTAFVHPFILGRNRFDLHTNCYFASLGDFERYHADIMRGVLTDMWNFLERPAKLVLKDPGMTRYANIILKLLPESRMLISIRDPKDVVASRVSIEMRRLGSDDPSAIGGDFVAAICREYNAVHEYVLTLDADALQQVKLVRYEQLVNGIGLSELSDFIGVTDIDTEFLWQRSLKMGERKSHSEWLSPLYGQKMSGDSIGRYRKVLGDAEIALIDAACMPTYDKLLEIGGWNEQT